jgi:excisionase family DNA binding protein
MASSSEVYLKTQMVADALGLSVSTIKRWVDSGTIHAVRTVGRHRLIPRSEALRMAVSLGLDSSRVRRLSGIPQDDFSGVDDSTCDRLCHLLREGQAQQAKVFIHSLYASGCGAVTLADALIRPVMARIGHGWMVGALDVFQEHQASHIVASAIIDLIGRESRERPPSGPLALSATTEGDPYVLSCLLIELILRERGWQVRNLGANLPLGSLANATIQYLPAMVCLSVNHLKNKHKFINECNAFYETARRVNTAVIVGGQALDGELRSKLLYTAFGDRMIHLAEFARRLTTPSRDAGPAMPVSGKALRPPPSPSRNSGQ